MTLQPTVCHVLPSVPQHGRISCIAAPVLEASLHVTHENAGLGVMPCCHGKELCLAGAPTAMTQSWAFMGPTCSILLFPSKHWEGRGKHKNSLEQLLPCVHLPLPSPQNLAPTQTPAQ